MSVFNESISIVENLYYLSGVFIAIFAFIGLYQLILTKKAVTISSEREAAGLSATQIDFFYNKFIPLVDNFSIEHASQKLPKIPSVEIGEFTVGYIKKVLNKDQINEVGKILLSVSIPWLRAINALEAMSVYFVKGVANEEIAFASIGNQFVDFVESRFVLIAILRKDKESCYFNNIIELYKLWENRIKKEDLVMQKEDLENKIKNIKDSKINPIGT